MTWSAVVAIAAAVIAACYAAALIVLVVASAITPPIALPLAELSPEDEALVAEAAARMKQYGNAVADRYDTPEGPQ
jgi:hypothetical protein